MSQTLEKPKGFTLAELLISLAILGIIATFTIPKVLNSSQNTTANAAAKEMIAMVSGAYQSYQLNNTITSTTAIRDLTPFMNYVRVITVTTTIDSSYQDVGDGCQAGRPCLVLHNGSVLHYDNNQSFGGTNTTNAIWAEFVESSEFKGDRDRAIRFFMYANGRVTTWGAVATGTTTSTLVFTPQPAYDAPWFNW